MLRIREWWYGLPRWAQRFILAELAVLAVLLVALVTARAVRAETYECVVHRGEWVWIREAPEPTARKIGRVRYGYEVQAGKPEGNWLGIEVRPGWLLEGERSEFGYVDASWFLRAVPEKMYRVATTGPLAKRETPGGRLMCWIKPGVRISVLGWRTDKDGTPWAHVYKGGYVCGKYLQEL